MKKIILFICMFNVFTSAPALDHIEKAQLATTSAIISGLGTVGVTAFLIYKSKQVCNQFRNKTLTREQKKQLFKKRNRYIWSALCCLLMGTGITTGLGIYARKNFDYAAWKQEVLALYRMRTDISKMNLFRQKTAPRIINVAKHAIEKIEEDKHLTQEDITALQLYIGKISNPPF